VRGAQAAGETMPANLSEGVLWQDVAIAVVYAEDARRRGEVRMVWDVFCDQVVGWCCGAAFAVAEGAQTQARRSGRSDPHLQRDFHMTTEVTAWEACERGSRV